LNKGESHPDLAVGNQDNARDLAPILPAQAEFLESVALDDSVWDE
jgi:hypothetical protein